MVPGALGESLRVLVLLLVLEAMLKSHLDTLELVTMQHLVLAGEGGGGSEGPSRCVSEGACR